MSDQDWTDEELRAAVNAYLEMLEKHREGEPFVKKDYYRRLAEQSDRTEKAFEYRAQNISQVFALLGRNWLPGLVPAKNVGTNVIARLERILADLEGRTATGEAAFENASKRAAKKERKTPPEGKKKPQALSHTLTNYERSPEVKGWVLGQAGGNCEACANPAPFNGHDGTPFLEVHHVRHLADGGSDTVQNAVAVCPNCHRALHYSEDKMDLVEALYAQVPRLVRE